MRTHGFARAIIIRSLMAVSALVSALTCSSVAATIQIEVERVENDQSSPEFIFKNVPRPLKTDAAASARFEIVKGSPDRNSGDVRKLHDGQLPFDADEPGENFFFAAGTDGGRILVDLGKTISVKQINTYSWHPDVRAPQVYSVYGSAGETQPPGEEKLEERGWKLLARVDTQTGARPNGGQVGVSISGGDVSLGKYRYLLFDVRPTESNTPFGLTFFSEIDVLDANAPPPEPVQGTFSGKVAITAGEGRYHITIDVSSAPELAAWVEEGLVPVVREWYPKLVTMLPSDGFKAPERLGIRFKSGMKGVPAVTSGNRITCNTEWFEQNLKGEALGCVVHEMVHVVQQYRASGRGAGNPSWLTEGIADYLRFFEFEPHSRGAAISAWRASRARYDASYRISANFLDWASRTYNKNLVQLLNQALRQGDYTDALWKQFTGFTPEELDAKWKAALLGKKTLPADESASGD